MKTILIIALLFPVLNFAQDDFNLPLNKAGTDIVYTKTFETQEKDFYKKILLTLNKHNNDYNIRNLNIDTLNQIILCNGTRVFYDDRSNDYLFQLDYLLSFRVLESNVYVSISNIYHKVENDDFNTLGYCFDFKDKTHRKKYYDVISKLQGYMPLEIEEIISKIKNDTIKQTLAVIKPVEINLSVVKNQNELGHKDYLLKSAESLSNFYKQKRTGHYLNFIGTGLLGASFSLVAVQQKNTMTSNTLLIVGGVFNLFGFIANIDSYKYIKESSMYLKKSVDGIGVGLKF